MKKIEEVLLPRYLGKSREIIEYNIKSLTAPGENYGSLMLAVDITVKNKEDGKEDVLHLAAKAVPQNEFVHKVFKSHLTFKKELEFYRTIVPTLTKFQKAQGINKVIDFFPDFYGGRLGLGSDGLFDTNAVILLENLKTSGYQCADRVKGFDLQAAKFILKNLATFHGVTIALKLKEPELFNNNVLPFLNEVKPFSGLNGETIKKVIEDVVDLAGLNAECEPFLKRIRRRLIESYEWLANPTTPREPFSTLIHCDIWVNNIMIKTEENKVISNKIVDFQITEYGSVVRDLIFFIFCSIQNEVVLESYNHLVQFYHRWLTNTLKQFDIDTKPFCLSGLENEINLAVKEGIFFHCLIMLKPIFAKEESVKDVEELSEEDISKNYAISQEFKEKLWMILTEFAKRNWI